MTPYAEQPVVKDKGATQEAETLDPIKSNSVLAEHDKDFAQYEDVAKPAIKELIGSWKVEINETKARRLTRYIDVDADNEKMRCNLSEDELFCPLRIVNTNIMTEQAKYAAYLTKPSRTAIFSCIQNAAQDTQILENDYTKKSRYKDWVFPYLKFIDGTETHAWDSIEIVFDPSKPGHFGREHVGHENLMFPMETRITIQNADFIVRTLQYTPIDLINFIRNKGWNSKQVSTLLGSASGEEGGKRGKSSSSYTVEKVFYRNSTNGLVYVGWSASQCCDDWLKAPTPLFIGRMKTNSDGMTVREYETEYPVELLPYQISEDEKIVNLKGRVFFDADKQEAASSLLTSFVTGFRRAISNYWVKDSNSPTLSDLSEAQTDITLVPNQLFNSAVKQFQLKAPDVSGLSVINTLIGQSQQESGNINYAVESNKSTRKTAEEVKAARSENDLLSGVQVTLLASSLANIENKCFAIYASRVKADLIPVPQEIAERLKNFSYILAPAGDTDFIERQQKIVRMQQSWPVYQQTGAESVFLKNLTQLLFPEEAQQYIQALDLSDQKDKILQALGNILQIFIQDPNVQQAFSENGQVKPEIAPYLQKLQEIYQQAMQVSQKSKAAGLPGVTPAPQLGYDTARPA